MNPVRGLLYVKWYYWGNPYLYEQVKTVVEREIRKALIGEEFSLRAVIGSAKGISEKMDWDFPHKTASCTLFYLYNKDGSAEFTIKSDALRHTLQTSAQLLDTLARAKEGVFNYGENWIEQCTLSQSKTGENTPALTE